MQTRQRILVGVIGAPHGVRGELRLKSFTANPLTIADLPGLGSEDGRRGFMVAASRLLKDDMLVVRFDGVTDRDAAQALTNLKIYVDRNSLPPVDEDEFYHGDLVGLKARTMRNEELGTVAAVQNFGAGDMLEIAPPMGETFYVPFTKNFVPKVDLNGGTVNVADEALPGPDDAEVSSDSRA